MTAKRSPAIWLSAEISTELRAAEANHLPVLARLGLAVTDAARGDSSLMQRLLSEAREAAQALNLAWVSQGWLGAVSGRKLGERRQLAAASRKFLAGIEAVRTEADAFARYSARFEDACLACLPEYTMHLSRLERTLSGIVPRLRTVYEDLVRKKERAGSQHVVEALERLRQQADAASDHLARQLETTRHARRVPLAVEDIRRCHAELEEQLEGIVASRAARVLQLVADALTAEPEAAGRNLAEADRLRTEVFAAVDTLLACLDRLVQRQQSLVQAFSGLARRLAEMQGAADTARA